MRHFPGLALAMVLFASSASLSAADAVPPPSLPATWDQFLSSGTGSSASPSTVRLAGREPHSAIDLEFRTAADREAACKAFKDPVHVVAQFENFALALVPTDGTALKQLLVAQGLVWFEISGEAEIPPPPKAPPVGSVAKDAPESIVRGGVLDGTRRLTGSGVVVAVIDSGIDFRHPDFIREVGGKSESRLLAFWDATREYKPGVGKPGPVTYPGGAPVGTVFTREDLTADLKENKLGVFDANGHGTACAGIAAGTGAALVKARAGGPPALAKMDYTGVAPDADLVGVRISDEHGSMTHGWLLNCVTDWVDRIAGKQPVVLSCSFGGHRGGHDGGLIQERWLTKWIERTNRPDAPARLVVVAAGNEAQRNIHGVAECSADKPGLITWKLEAPDRGRPFAQIRLYFDSDSGLLDADDFEIEANAETRKKVAMLKPVVNPLTRVLSVTINVTEAGPGTLRVKGTGRKTLRVDGYISSQRGPNGFVGQFTAPCVHNERQICTPATALGVIAVGSYDFNPRFLGPKGLGEIPTLTVGQCSEYSNAGFYRTGKSIKPDLTAPGFFHIAPAPAPLPDEDLLRDFTGSYQAFDGTSAATPYVAGIAALLLQKKPTLSSEEARKLLHGKATADSYTGAVPNPNWGHGKLDLAAVQRIVEGLKTP